MPRYYFNLQGDSSEAPDLVGRKLEDDEAAKSEALQLAAELGANGAFEGSPPTYEWIEVLDESQRSVARLPVQNALREPTRLR